MSASAVRGGQVYVEIGADPNKFIAALRAINQRVADMGETLRSTGVGMMAVGAAISGPILALGGAFVEQTGEMLAMRAALKDIGKATAEAVAPAFVGLANVIAGAARAVARFIRDNQALVRLAVVIGGYFTAWGAATYGVGIALKTISGAIAASIGPISTFGEMAKKAALAFVAFATSGPVLAVVGVLAGAAAGAAAAGVDFRRLAETIGGVFRNPIGELRSLFGDLLGTVNLTVEGIYRAIAAGDLRGAVDVLWAGWQAAWARGDKALMDALDPMIEDMQNVFSDFGVDLAVWWEQMWVDIATSEWGGYILGAMDNVINGVMAYWDNMIGYLQKGWAKFGGWWSKNTADMNKELDRIDKANADRAAERDRLRPGFAGRTGLTDEQKEKMRKEAADRQAAMLAEGEKMRQERRDRTQKRLKDRQDAVDQANRNLRDQVNRFPVPPPVVIPGEMKTSVAGTFSGFAVDQMAGGGQSIQKQQLEALLKIQAGIDEANRVGVVVA